MRRTLVPTLTALGLAASGLALTASPAHAAFTTTIGALDVSTPGHVTGTVATDAPYVEVALSPNDWDDRLEKSVLPTVDGVATFDFETWGLTTGNVVARACTEETPAGCDPEVVSETFTATDVDPEVTWPEDTTIGAGQQYPVTVSDPTGGGVLVATWDPDGVWMFEGTALEEPGPTPIQLGEDGTGEIMVTRCHRSHPSICRPTGVTRHITVNRRVSHYIVSPMLGEVGPAAGMKLRPVIHVNEGQDFTLDWQVRDSLTLEVVAGVGGQVTGLVADSAREIRPVLDVSGVTTNGRDYNVTGTLTYSDPDFDTVSGPTNPMLFRVDTVAPAITSVSRNRATVYPYKDTYQDTVAITVRPAAFSYTDVARIAVVNANGVVVRNLAMGTPDGVTYTTTWNGRTSAGSSVPAGTYSLRATLTDEAKNVGTLEQRTVIVARKKLAARTYTRTVSASGSLFDKYVGACSSLRKPSARGWAGSLGLYSNTKCRRTFDASLVQSVHAMRMPSAVKYGSFRVSAYGGAARAKPNSWAYIGYINRQGSLTADTVMKSSVRTWNGPLRSGGGYVFDDRSLIWTAYEARGSRYDLKSFTVRMPYQVLVAE